MTEAEWLYGDDLQAKVDHLGGEFSFRKARLFAVACGRAASWTGRPQLEAVLDVLERMADDPLGVADAELYAAFRQAAALLPTGFLTRHEFAAEAAEWARRGTPERVMSTAATVCAQVEGRLEAETRRAGLEPLWDPAALYALEHAILRQYDSLLADIAGNPFDPVEWPPAWRTADVVGVSRGIYEDRAFDRLPLLADALMDAGCADERVLGHCRDAGPHVRGCWVVDLALGQS